MAHAPCHRRGPKLVADQRERPAVGRRSAVLDRVRTVVEAPGTAGYPPLLGVKRVGRIELVKPLDAGDVVDIGDLPTTEVAFAAAEEPAAALVLVADQHR